MEGTWEAVLYLCINKRQTLNSSNKEQATNISNLMSDLNEINNEPEYERQQQHHQQQSNVQCAQS